MADGVGVCLMIGWSAWMAVGVGVCSRIGWSAWMADGHPDGWVCVR